VKLSLIREYLRLFILEAKIARVPQQLVHDEESDSESNEDKKNDKENVDEFSSAGAIYGYTAPIAMLGNQRRPKK
jgi:hypothetical protein